MPVSQPEELRQVNVYFHCFHAEIKKIFLNYLLRYFGLEGIYGNNSSFQSPMIGFNSPIEAEWQL